MTNLADRPNSARGDRRREQLVETGIALLDEQGWPGVTTRAVAERAGTNPGLIHYHFGGLPGLHAAIFRRATDLVVNPRRPNPQVSTPVIDNPLARACSLTSSARSRRSILPCSRRRASPNSTTSGLPAPPKSGTARPPKAESPAPASAVSSEKEADDLRKAMGKKDPEVMERQHARFIEGVVENGGIISRLEKCC